MQMVLAARAGGLGGAGQRHERFRDLDAFARECAEGAAMGFDGKTLIHPAQIEPAKMAFSPSAEAIAEAEAIRSRHSPAGKYRQGRISDRRPDGRAPASCSGRAAAGASGTICGAAALGDLPCELYRFLSGPDDSSFCHKVTAALNKGWHLYGSPTYAFDAETKAMRCGQGVVKDVDGVDYDPEIKLSDY